MSLETEVIGFEPGEVTLNKPGREEVEVPYSGYIVSDRAAQGAYERALKEIAREKREKLEEE